MMKGDAQYWIEKLALQPHPEGGYYRETYRSQEVIDTACLPPRYNSDRNLSTAIYYLLQGDQFSAFHRLRSDEIWHFYTGSPLLLHTIEESGKYSKIILGPDFEKGEVFQAVVPHGGWFGAEVTVANSFSLLGCTLAPGFDFADFELGNRKALIQQFPRHAELIKRLCR
ncbi:MAG: cupin domain-containing protein [Calditrichia bacterium]